MDVSESVEVEVDDPPGRVREIARGSLATLTAFRHHAAEPHRDPREERFERPVVIFTTFGSWGLRSPAGTVEANLETIVVGAAGHPYRASHEGSRPVDTTFCVEFGEAPPHPLITDDAWHVAFARGSAPRTAAIAWIQRALAHEADGRGTGYAMKIDGLAMELIAELARVNGGGGRATGPGSSGIRPDLRERVHAARSYLDRNLVDDIDLHVLGRAVALSPFYLSRLFRQEFGIPPHAYLSRVRLEHGAELLATTPLSVTQISARVGWQSVSHFTARFRRHFGVTPTAYRDLSGP
jgi:AraC-like DNA-binding protein